MISALSKSHLSVIGDKCLDIMSLISLALLTSKRGGPITVFYCQSSTSIEIRAALLAERRNSSLTDRRKGRRGRTEISAGIRCCMSVYSKKKPDVSKDRTTTETALDHVFQQIQHPTGGALEISVTLLSYYSLTNDLTYTVPLHKFQIRLQYTCTKHMAIST